MRVQFEANAHIRGKFMNVSCAREADGCCDARAYSMPGNACLEKRVLIVENQHTNALFIESILRQHRFNVVGFAEQGIEAVRQTLLLQPDLIVMDIMLPGGMNGIETAREISRRVQVPFVFMSDSMNCEMLAAVRACEPYGYIRKPFTADELLIGIEMAESRFTLEKELRENEKMFRLQFEQESDAIIIFDTTLQSISDVNDAVVRLYGFMRDELIGNNLLMLMDSTNLDSLYRAFENVQPDNPFMLLRQEHRRKDGTAVPVYCRGRIIDINGRQHLYCSIRDITEKIRKEEEDALMQAQFLHSEKMASIGVLATGIAHEINNPMAFISSNLTTLDKYLKKIQQFAGFVAQTLEPCVSDAIREKMLVKKKGLNIDYVLQDAVDLVAESTSGAERIKKIVQDLRLFARADSDEPESFDVHDYIENTINIIWNELKYKAQLEKNYGQVPCMIGYPQKLSQVVMNLLVNAAHAIENQGTITITTWSEAQDVYISIADTGCGIEEKNLKKIFEPFFTTKEAGKGNGLGLSIACDIVTKKLNGALSVESKVGVGTTFTLRLPIACTAQPDVEPAGAVINNAV
jgi:PAS domain S-box-containing protein